MPEKKKQHYVPQFYMSFFSFNSRDFAVFSIHDKKTRYPVSYKNQCYKDYYYGNDGIWEERLSEMETKWVDIMRHIHEKKPILPEDIKHLKLFVLYQRQRTIGLEKYTTQVRE